MEEPFILKRLDDMLMKIRGEFIFQGNITKENILDRYKDLPKYAKTCSLDNLWSFIRNEYNNLFDSNKMFGDDISYKYYLMNKHKRIEDLIIYHYIKCLKEDYLDVYLP
jgi:hypothetical protein